MRGREKGKHNKPVMITRLILWNGPKAFSNLSQSSNALVPLQEERGMKRKSRNKKRKKRRKKVIFDQHPTFQSIISTLFNSLLPKSTTLMLYLQYVNSDFQVLVMSISRSNLWQQSKDIVTKLEIFWQTIFSLVLQEVVCAVQKVDSVYFLSPFHFYSSSSETWSTNDLGFYNSKAPLF